MQRQYLPPHTRALVRISTLGFVLTQSNALFAEDAAAPPAPPAAVAPPAALAPNAGATPSASATPSSPAPPTAPAPPTPAPAASDAPSATAVPAGPAPSPAPVASVAPAAPTAAPAAGQELTRSLVHLGSSYPGAWLELRSSVDEGDWQRACAAPCDKSIVVAGTLARVTAPGMTRSNAFRIEPGPGTALIRVDGGSASARTFGILSLGVGIPIMLTGGTLYSYGKFADREGMRDAGAVVLGVGALAIIASLPLLFAGATTVRDGRGSAIAKVMSGAPEAL